MKQQLKAGVGKMNLKARINRLGKTLKPKGLQAWEKKALEAGWVPPKDRAKELGI